MKNISVNTDEGITTSRELIPVTPSSDVVQEAIDKLVNQLNEINKPQEEN
jgi:hypothetical protein